jgi:hypothetical protein
LVGITILNARSTLEQRGSVTITTPAGPLEASRDELAPVLASRAA